MSAQPTAQPTIYPQFSRKTGSFVGVAANGVATYSVPLNGRHYQHRLHFKTAAGANLTQAQIEAEVTNIKVKIDGVTIIEATPAFLNMLQKYYGDAKGAAIVPGVLLIDYCRRSLTLPIDRKMMALGMQGVSNFIIEVYTAAVPNLGIIDFVSTVENVESQLGPHYRIIQNPQFKSTTGEHQISDLPKYPNAALLAYHISVGSVPGVLSEVSLISDVNNSLVERIAPTVQQQILEDAGRNPQTGFYHIDFNVNNEVMGYVPWMVNGKMIQDWRLSPTWSTAPNDFRVHTELVYNIPKM